MNENNNINFEPNPFETTAKSKVKLIKNTKGVNWEVSVVSGEENLIEGLMKKAIEIHNKIEKEVNQK